MKLIIRLGLCALAACTGLVALAIGVGILTHGNVIASNILDESSSAPRRIFLFDVNAGLIHRISFDHLGQEDDSYPVWSPDGQRMAFVHYDYEQGYWVCVMDMGGADARCITAGINPAWVSSDGSLLAFVFENVMYVMNVETGATVNPSGYEYDGVYLDAQSDPTWSAHSNLIAFTWEQGTAREIYVVEPHGDGLVNLTNHRAHDYNPTWSPDGQQIAFVSRRGDDAQIYLMNSVGTELRQLTHGAYGVDHISWSPDGTQIVYDDNLGGILLVNVDDSGVAWLTEGEHPAWSPDGRQIAFIGPPGMNSHLYVMNRDGSNIIPLVSYSFARFDDYPPVWHP